MDRSQRTVGWIVSPKHVPLLISCSMLACFYGVAVLLCCCVAVLLYQKCVRVVPRFFRPASITF